MLLEQIHDPSDVRKLNDEQARLLCRELRTFLLEQVSRTGGHLASNLGVVELTVAIHRVFDTVAGPSGVRRGTPVLRPQGPHRRREAYGTLRRTWGGLSGFPKPGRAPTTPLSRDTPLTQYRWPWNGTGTNTTASALSGAGADR